MLELLTVYEYLLACLLWAHAEGLVAVELIQSTCWPLLAGHSNCQWLSWRFGYVIEAVAFVRAISLVVRAIGQRSP